MIRLALAVFLAAAPASASLDEAFQAASSRAAEERETERRIAAEQCREMAIRVTGFLEVLDEHLEPNITADRLDWGLPRLYPEQWSRGVVVQVSMVRAGSAAAAAGLRQYDLLVRANGQDVAAMVLEKDGDYDTLPVLRFLHQAPEPLTLDIERQGRKFTVSLPKRTRISAPAEITARLPELRALRTELKAHRVELDAARAARDPAAYRALREKHEALHDRFWTVRRDVNRALFTLE